MKARLHVEKNIQSKRDLKPFFFLPMRILSGVKFLEVKCIKSQENSVSIENYTSWELCEKDQEVLEWFFSNKYSLYFLENCLGGLFKLKRIEENSTCPIKIYQIWDFLHNYFEIKMSAISKGKIQEDGSSQDILIIVHKRVRSWS